MFGNFTPTQILACQAARVAVTGVYPFFFPKAGYKGQLAWLRDTAACGGEDAFSILLSAAREGEVQLPRHVDIRHASGQSVHLGPALTIPRPRDLKRSPALSLEVVAGRLVTSHREVERQEKREAVWELQVPEPPEVEEGKVEDGEVENGEVEDGEVEEGEGDEKQNLKKKKKEEDMEETQGEPMEEGPAEVNHEEVERQQEQEVARRKKIFVDCNDLGSVTLEQLRAHFEQFDKVDDIYMFGDHTVVTLKSAFIAQALAGRNITLQRSAEQGGSVPLRLRGGSSRGRSVPPRQQRDNVCPFR